MISNSRILRIVILLAILPLISCNDNPFRIGFVGTMSGSNSSLGIEERNSVQLAVDRINESGGINGRSLELLIRDDEQTPERGREIIREYIDLEVDVIIGHTTSTMTLATVDLVNGAEIMMISPTASTDLLKDIDDYFYRATFCATDEVEVLARYVRDRFSADTISAALDRSNSVYTERWIEVMEEQFRLNGGALTDTYRFNSSEEVSYKEIAQDLLKNNPDSIAISAGAVDTALICQQIRILNPDIPILSSRWAKSLDFINNTGAAVNNVFFTEPELVNYDEAAYKGFERDFRDTYGYSPSFGAVQAYNAVLLVREGLSIKNDKEPLKDALGRITDLDGVQGRLHYNQFGDIIVNQHIIHVVDSSFKKIGQNN